MLKPSSRSFLCPKASASLGRSRRSKSWSRTSVGDRGAEPDRALVRDLRSASRRRASWVRPGRQRQDARRRLRWRPCNDAGPPVDAELRRYAAAHHRSACMSLPTHMSRLTDVEVNDLVTTGHQVLSVYPRIPGACVMMSALLVGRLHDLGHASASLVGGELAIGTTVIFGRSASRDHFPRLIMTGMAMPGSASANISPMCRWS